MYILETLPGLEESLINEVKGVQILPTLVESNTKKSDIAYVISKLIAKIKFKNEKDLLYQISNLELDIDNNFFVKCKNKELEKEIAKTLIQKGFVPDPKTNNPLKVYLGNGLAIITQTIVINNEKRAYRFKRHNQSIDSCIANALILESGIKKTNSVLDPFCKDSVILIEAFKKGITKLYGFDTYNNIRNSTINAKLAKASIIFEETKFDDIIKKTDFCLTTLPIMTKNNFASKLIDKFFKKIFTLCKTIGIITYNPDEIKEIIKLNKLSIKKEFNIKKGSQNISIFIFKSKK
ncbi:MAG: hypothetical protein PHT54_01990 [Candidatus Nanoarchaeia archaeon]|nr:hypothetical protein [Candidatus Nanoarchaeia archaeon]